MLVDEFGGFFAGALGEAAGEDEDLAGEFLAFDFALFDGGAHAGFVELLDNVAIGGLGEKFDDAAGDFGADFADLSSCSWVAAANSSSEEKCSARSWPVRSPTKRMPRA